MFRLSSEESPKVNLFCGEHVAYATVSGGLSVRELVNIVDKYCELIGRRHVLWDFTNADLSKIDAENFADIAALLTMKLGPLAGRKTGYAAGDSGKYAQLCGYLIAAFPTGIPAQYCVFMDRQSATEWLSRK